MHRLPLIAFTAILLHAAVSSCKGDSPVGVGDVEAETVPTMTTRDVETLISDSGVVRYRITTPVWYVYDEIDTPYWHFPQTLNLVKYNNLFQTEATVRADSAIYFKRSELWRLDGNVRISNTAGEKFLTEQLFWDQRQHKLYSDSFIHIERQDRVLEGYGFDSNDQLTRYTIRRVSGIFPAADFKSRHTEEAPSDNTEDTYEAPTPATTDTIRSTTAKPSAAPRQAARS